MAKKYHPDKLQSKDPALIKELKKNFKRYKKHMKQFKMRGLVEFLWFYTSLVFGMLLIGRSRPFLFYNYNGNSFHIYAVRKLLVGNYFYHWTYPITNRELLLKFLFRIG